MTVFEKLEEIKDLIKINLESQNINNYNYYIGRPEILQNKINENSNIFPLIIFSDINFKMEQSYSQVFSGKIYTNLIISDIDNNRPIFDFLDKNILRNCLKTIQENGDMIVQNIIYDDSIDSIYSIICEIEISFDFSI